MSIEHFVGTEGPTINVESIGELYQVLDLIHTQVMDNLNKDRELLDVLENAMTSVDKIADKRNVDIDLWE